MASTYDINQKKATSELFNIACDEFNASELLKVYYSQGRHESLYYLWRLAHHHNIDNMVNIDYSVLLGDLLKYLK